MSSADHRTNRYEPGMSTFLEIMNRSVRYKVPADAGQWVILDAILQCLSQEGPQDFASLSKLLDVGVIRLSPVLSVCQRSGLMAAVGAPGRELFTVTTNGQTLLPVLKTR